MPILPNRPQLGKKNSLLYTFLVAMFLLWQGTNVKINQHGFEVSSREVGVEILALCLVLMAVGLGINVLETLKEITRLVTEIAKIVNRNSQRLDHLEPEIKNLIDSGNQDSIAEKSSTDNESSPPL